MNPQNFSDAMMDSVDVASHRDKLISGKSLSTVAKRSQSIANLEKQIQRRQQRRATAGQRRICLEVDLDDLKQLQQNSSQHQKRSDVIERSQLRMAQEVDVYERPSRIKAAHGDNPSDLRPTENRVLENNRIQKIPENFEKSKLRPAWHKQRR